MDVREREHEHFCFILGVLITNKVSFSSKTEEMKKQLFLFRSMLKKFCKNTYHQFFVSSFVARFFKLLQLSGLIEKLLKTYPKLSQSFDSYLKIAASIAEFEENPRLLQ